MTAPAWTIEDHLRDKAAAAVQLYRTVETILLDLGEVRRSPSKTTINFKGPRRGFASAKPSLTGVEGYFDIMRSLDTSDPRIQRVTPYQSNLFVHHYRLTDATGLDEEFLGWLREAYQVGSGAHLRA